MDQSVTTADQFGGNRGLQGPFCVEVTFRETTKFREVYVVVFPVTVFDETLRNQCGIAPLTFSSHRFPILFYSYGGGGKCFGLCHMFNRAS